MFRRVRGVSAIARRAGGAAHGGRGLAPVGAFGDHARDPPTLRIEISSRRDPGRSRPIDIPAPSFSSEPVAEGALPPEWRREAAWALGGYALLLLICFALGYRMNVPYWYFQFLDVRLLQDHLWESMLYLHAQPPMLNLLLAGALHLQDATGLSVNVTTFVFHALLGAAAVPATVALCGVLIPDRFRRRLLIGILVCHPVFYTALFSFFYTFQEIVILALLGCAVWRFLKSGSPWAFAGVCALLVWIVYTRSLFHFVWAAAIPVALLLGSRGEHFPGRRPAMEFVAMGLMLAALFAWPMKNHVIFDSFTYSTWQGYSISKGMIPTPLDSEIPRPDPPPPFDEIPALAWDEKIDPDNSGIPTRNWNHYALIGDFKDRQHRAFEAIKNDPVRRLKRMGYHYWSFSRFTGRHPYTGQFGTMAKEIPRLADPWMRLYEAVLVQEIRSPLYLRNPYFRQEETRFWHVSGFFFTFPLIVGFAGRKIWKRWRTHRVEARVAALMLYTVLWVFAMIIGVDGDEANRIRTSTEPYTIMLAMWVIPPAFFETIRNRGRKPKAGGADS